MAERQQNEEKPMPTIWRMPDGLWEKIEPILEEHDPSKGTGRPLVDQRAALDAVMVFCLRTGCQWNRLPKEFPARRWVVERTRWAGCRSAGGLLVRYDKKARNYLGMVKLTCALLWYRCQHRLALLR